MIVKPVLPNSTVASTKGRSVLDVVSVKNDWKRVFPFDLA